MPDNNKRDEAQLIPPDGTVVFADGGTVRHHRPKCVLRKHRTRLCDVKRQPENKG